MKTPTTSKTLGPLHLEDLEPHRFEDLVRQLLYDFRPWREIEATGRSGSDGGFDVRAWEELGASRDAADDDAATDLELDAPAPARQWLVQCKREQRIAPAKLKSYLDGLPDASAEGIHGIVFVAACDFSRAARDLFYQRGRELGFMELRLWGKAELEDQLFQPKNDHLLFAYFGISLQVRKRTLKTEIRARLATKKKAKKELNYGPVLIRDGSDDRYPYPDPDTALPEINRRRWKVYTCLGCFHDGVHLELRRHHAYIGDNQESWDASDWQNEVYIPAHDDPWAQEREKKSNYDDPLWQQWHALADKNKAWLEFALVLPYEQILAIDEEEGDEFCRAKHIFVDGFDGKRPFLQFLTVKLENNQMYGKVRVAPDLDKRIKFFNRPKDLDQESLDYVTTITRVSS